MSNTDEQIVATMIKAIIESSTRFTAIQHLHVALAAAKPLITAEAREKALREAAQTVRAVPENPLFDTEEGTASRICGFAANAILALLEKPK